MTASYPHSEWTPAADRARLHRTTIDKLANACPVEQGKEGCHVCCAVSTDAPGPTEMHTAPTPVGNAGTTQSADLHSASALNPQADQKEPGDNMAADPNIKHLHKIVAAFRKSEAQTKKLRAEVDRYIQELKRQGYSYPLLARESTFAQGTIQLIVAKETEQ